MEMVLSRQIELVSILWDIIFLQGHLYTIVTGPFTVIIARFYGKSQHDDVVVPIEGCALSRKGFGAGLVVA